jgi:putative transposase
VRRYRLIEQEKAHHGVSPLARVLGVARAGDYAWSSRPASARALADRALTEQIPPDPCPQPRHRWRPRVHAELHLGLDVQVGRVARLLGAAGLQGCHRRRRPGLTRRDPKPSQHPTWSSATLLHQHQTGCGWPTSPSSAPMRRLMFVAVKRLEASWS